MSVTQLYLLCHDMRIRSRKAIGRFIREERGDAIQNVMILAVAAVLLVALLKFGRDALAYLVELFNQIKS